MSEALIHLSGVTRHFRMGDETVVALAGIDLRIDMGEMVAIVGTSGSGKTTLMNVLGLLDTPTAGTYELTGRQVQDLPDDEQSQLRNAAIGFVFQNFHLLPRLSALKNVELPLTYRGLPRRERTRLATGALARVGLENRMRHRPNQLSGGQRQRVAIARALATRPSLLLADEPTGNLDSATEQEIMHLFEQLHAAGGTIVIVTHEPAIAARCPRAIRLDDGRIVADGPGREVARQLADRIGAVAAPAQTKAPA